MFGFILGGVLCGSLCVWGSLQMPFPCVWMFMIGLRGVLSGYVILNVDWLKLFTRAALTTMVKKKFQRLNRASSVYWFWWLEGFVVVGEL